MEVGPRLLGTSHKDSLSGPRKWVRSVQVELLLGEGANNKAELVVEGGTRYVYRRPLPDSDTRDACLAAHEYRNARVADSLRVGPKLRGGWYCKDDDDKDFRKGLHLVYEYYEKDVHFSLLEEGMSDGEREDLARQTEEHIRCMSRCGLFLYDLKPANMVIRFEEVEKLNSKPQNRPDASSAPFECRFIDFAPDYCEYNPWDKTEQKDLTAFVRKKKQEAGRKKETEKGKKDAKGEEVGEQDPYRVTNTLKSILLPPHRTQRVYGRVLHALMMVLLSGILTFIVEDEKKSFPGTRKERIQLSYLRERVKRLRSEMKGHEVRAVRTMLRHEDVRAVVRHYVGGRNASTKRMFELSHFVR